MTMQDANDLHIITGSIINDATIRKLPGGKQVVLELDVSVTRSYQDKEQNLVYKNKVYRVNRYFSAGKYNKGKLKIHETLKKGLIISVMGEPEAQAWIKKNNQNKIELDQEGQPQIIKRICITTKNITILSGQVGFMKE